MFEALERLRNRCGLARLPRAYDDLDESSLLVDSFLYDTYIMPFISHYGFPISQILFIISQILRDSKNRAACHYREVVLTEEPEMTTANACALSVAPRIRRLAQFATIRSNKKGVCKQVLLVAAANKAHDRLMAVN